MDKKETQLRIAAILKDIGLDNELIKTMTSLSQEEINNVNT
jgi:predicted transposase YdaD